MQIKMINTDKISEETKAKFYEFMDEASRDFRKEAGAYLDKLYSIRNIWTYYPSSIIIKICSSIIYFCILFEVATLLNNYINYMIYNANVLLSSIISFIFLIFQFVLASYLLYGAMMRDEEYKHDCFIKFVNSDCVKKYEGKLLKKAAELNIELEVVRDDE